MRILGVSNAWDAGAALVVDGRIVAAVNEERFSRVKLAVAFLSDRSTLFSRQQGWASMTSTSLHRDAGRASMLLRRHRDSLKMSPTR